VCINCAQSIYWAQRDARMLYFFAEKCSWILLGFLPGWSEEGG
jgi:hypothetical protein